MTGFTKNYIIIILCIFAFFLGGTRFSYAVEEFTERLRLVNSGPYAYESVSIGDFVSVSCKPEAIRTPFTGKGYEGITMEVYWSKGPRKGISDKVLLLPYDTRPPSNRGWPHPVVDFKTLERGGGFKLTSGDYMVRIIPTDYSAAKHNVMMLWGSETGRNMNLNLFQYVEFTIEGLDKTEP